MGQEDVAGEVFFTSESPLAMLAIEDARVACGCFRAKSAIAIDGIGKVLVVVFRHVGRCRLGSPLDKRTWNIGFRHSGREVDGRWNRNQKKSHYPL